MEENIGDLIAEAREFIEGKAQSYGYTLIRRLADALEAVARQPSEDDREAAFESGMESIDWDMVRDGVGDPQEAAGVAVRAALGTLAAVPDAATEEAFKKAGAFDKAVALSERRQTLLEEAEAERDAAVAAIERVRSLHRKFTYYELEDSCPDTSEDHREERHHESDEIGEFYCEDMPTGDVACDLCRDADGEHMEWPCPTIQALDGAPEPEDKPCTVEAHSWVRYRPEQIDSYWIRCTLLGKHDVHEDSHTGLKWRSGLPVEGESNGV